MRSFAFAFAATIALGACERAAVPATVPGTFTQADREIPVMGSVTGFIVGEAFAWETLDFSVGALDGSAWIGSRDGSVVLTITGYPAGTGGAAAGRVQIVTEMPNGLAPGPGANAAITLFETEGDTGPRLQSTGQPLVNVSNFVRFDDINGSVQGTFVTTLCFVAGPDSAPEAGECRDVAGEFDTRVQFDGV